MLFNLDKELFNSSFRAFTFVALGTLTVCSLMVHLAARVIRGQRRLQLRIERIDLGASLRRQLESTERDRDLQQAALLDKIEEVRQHGDDELRTSMQWVIRRLGLGPADAS